MSTDNFQAGLVSGEGRDRWLAAALAALALLARAAAAQHDAPQDAPGGPDGMPGNLAGWWRFEAGLGDGAATVRDWSGNGRDAIILDTERVSRAAAGPAGAALRFGGGAGGLPDGAPGAVVVPALDGVSLAGGFTLAAWVCRTSADGDAPIISRTGDPVAWGDGFALHTDAAGTVSAYMGDWSLPGGKACAGSLAEGEWVHLCLVFDGTDAVLYRDGDAAGRIEGVGPGADAQGPFCMGPIEGCPFEGYVADVRLYTAPLSAGDVGRLYSLYDAREGDLPVAPAGPAMGVIGGPQGGAGPVVADAARDVNPAGGILRAPPAGSIPSPFPLFRILTPVEK